LLVTEPTPFGLNDLKLAVELVRELSLPFAVVINRDGIGDEEVERYCVAQDIDIAFRLPDDRRIAEAYSSGRMIVDVLDDYKRQFLHVCDYLESAKSEVK
jgi:MinD superfamily P-loop ATPase